VKGQPLKKTNWTTTQLTRNSGNAQQSCLWGERGGRFPQGGWGEGELGGPSEREGHTVANAPGMGGESGHLRGGRPRRDPYRDPPRLPKGEGAIQREIPSVLEKKREGEKICRQEGGGNGVGRRANRMGGLKFIRDHMCECPRGGNNLNGRLTNNRRCGNEIMVVLSD